MPFGILHSGLNTGLQAAGAELAVPQAFPVAGRTPVLGARAAGEPRTSCALE